MNYDDLKDSDLRFLWHPYTDIVSFEKTRFPIIERADGLYLYDVNGKPILDGVSSWWGVNLGHSHPRIVEAITTQAPLLQHSIIGGMSHPNAIRLAEKLVEITPDGLDRVFFAGDGSSAVEAALKISLQYFYNTGHPRRNRFVALQDAYHGDTLGAMGVGFVPGFHTPYESVLRKSLRADSPHCFHCPAGKSRSSCDVECFASMEGIVTGNHSEIAAVIVEPLCQGAAGMRLYPEEYLRRLRALCDRYSILLIADEIAVGFGRTGHMFACDRAGISPDLMCLGKGLTGGMLPMSATLASAPIYASFRSTPETDRTFYHGHTYCGNPITSAAALAAIGAYIDDEVVEKSEPSSRALAAGFEKLRSLDTVADTASLHMIGTLEVTPSAGGAAFARAVASKALDLGLQIRPLGPVIYIWPPLITPPDTVREMLDLLETALKETSAQ